MKVLVTGSTGFIGSSLVPMLKREGHDVYEIIRYVSGGRYDYYDREKRYFADLRDRDSITSAVSDCKPEVIINLAAQTAVSFSFINPVDVMLTNAVAVVALAEAAREVGVKQFIHASTSEVYGREGARFPLKEDSPLGATSPYAVAKIAAEDYLWLIHQIYEFPVTIMRPFNSYGRATGGVSNRHYVVERAICQALETGKINLHNPNPRRDFLFREDHCMGYVKAVGNEVAIGEAINLCTGKCWSIQEMAWTVAHVVGDIIGKPVEVNFTNVPDRPKDIDVLHGDASKAYNLLHWEPQWSFVQGISQAVGEWKEVLFRK